MTKRVLKEWFIDAPWGSIALISWGNPNGSPVLLVHGREDSVAGFVPLLEMLPDEYYYVGVDLPGHGLSDPFPLSVALGRFHFVLAVDIVLKHLNWKQFTYIGHSLGAEIGLFYHAIYPSRMTKFVQLDPGLPMQRTIMASQQDHFETFYLVYYENYNKMNHDNRVYSKRRALDAVKKYRGLTDEQAELILSRNLKKIGEDQYKLSWDQRIKNLAPLNIPTDYCIEIFSKNAPPTLAIHAKHSRSYSTSKKDEVDKLFEGLQSKTKYFVSKYVDGGHDVHVTNPERFAKDVCEFLRSDFKETTSKL